MNKDLKLLLELLSLGAGAATVVGGDVASGANIASSLIGIIQRSIAVYESQVGAPIDPALIKPYVPLD